MHLVASRQQHLNRAETVAVGDAFAHADTHKENRIDFEGLAHTKIVPKRKQRTGILFFSRSSLHVDLLCEFSTGARAIFDGKLSRAEEHLLATLTLFGEC